jgi:hypothetical protein
MTCKNSMAEVMGGSQGVRGGLATEAPRQALQKRRTDEKWVSALARTEGCHSQHTPKGRRFQPFRFTRQRQRWAGRDFLSALPNTRFTID